MQSGLIPPIVLIALATLFLGVEFARPPAAPRPLPAFHVTHPTRVASGVATRNGEAEAATVLARPLFSSGRRPPADDAVTGTSAALPRLSAILVSGALRRVVFETGDKQTVLGVGGHAGPYTVDSISAQAITVATQDGTRTLRPQALPDDGSTAAAAAAPRAPTGAFNVLDELRRGTPSTGSSPSPIQELIARIRHRG